MIELEADPPPRVYCNAFWGNHDIFDLCSLEDGQWWSCQIALGYEGVGDFYSVLADPLLCGEEDLTVSKGSPLATPPGAPRSPIGGARGFGCGQTVVPVGAGSGSGVFCGMSLPLDSMMRHHSSVAG